MAFTEQDYEVLLNPTESDHKTEIINKICIHIQKDPFNILQYNPKILRNLQIRDILNKRESSLFLEKEFSQKDQLSVIASYPELFKFIKNVTPKTLLSLINIHGGECYPDFWHKVSPSVFSKYKELINHWNREERMLAISKEPNIIKYFKTISYDEICFAISHKGSLILSYEATGLEYENDSFLRSLALKNNCNIVSSYPNPTFEELIIAFSRASEIDLSILLKTIHELPPEIIDLCLEKSVDSVLTNHPQTVEICLKALNLKPSCWSLIKIAHGDNYEDVLLCLNEKKELISLINN